MLEEINDKASRSIPEIVTPNLPAPTTAPNQQKNRFFLFVNGINQKKNEFTQWHLSAERWIESNRTPPNWRADTFSYFVGIFDRWRKQDKLINECCKILTDRQSVLPEDEIIAVGHSNGCAILCETLKQNPNLKISELHLIGSAAEASCDKNGINDAIARGSLGLAMIYWSEQDEALTIGEATHWLSYINAKWGYGNMGKVGPKDRRSNMIRDKLFEGFEHSTYFDPGNFDMIMNRVINHGDFVGPDSISNVNR